jgi:hypothetical protein
MESAAPPNPSEAADRTRLFLSLAAAALISAAGLVSIFLFAAWLVPHWTIWTYKHPGSGNFLVPISILFVVLMAARRRRGARRGVSSPKRAILPL